MTQSETVSVADRLTQAATDLRSGARSRAEIVCELIEALGETDELVGKHATVWSDGDIPFSHPHPNQSGLILVRPVDLEAPRADAFDLHEPYITDDELAALLSRRADRLRFGERSRQSVLEDLVYLVASEPGVTTFEETGNRGVGWCAVCGDGGRCGGAVRRGRGGCEVARSVLVQHSIYNNNGWTWKTRYDGDDWKSASK